MMLFAVLILYLLRQLIMAQEPTNTGRFRIRDRTDRALAFAACAGDSLSEESGDRRNGGQCVSRRSLLYDRDLAFILPRR